MPPLSHAFAYTGSVGLLLITAASLLLALRMKYQSRQLSEENRALYAILGDCRDGMIVSLQSHLYANPATYQFCISNQQDISPESDSPELNGFLRGLDDTRRRHLRQNIDMLREHGKGFVCSFLARCDSLPVRVVGKRLHHGTKGNSIDVIWVQDDRDGQDLAATRNDNARLRQDADDAHAMLDTLPFPFWRKNSDGAVITTNREYRKSIAILPDRVRRLTIPSERANNPSETKGEPTILAPANNTNQPTSDTPAIFHEGKPVLARIHEIPYRDGMIGVAYDASEIHRLREALWLNAKARDLVLDCSTTATVIYDSDQSLRYYNPAFANMTGLDKSFLDSSPSLELVVEACNKVGNLPQDTDMAAMGGQFNRWFRKSHYVDPARRRLKERIDKPLQSETPDGRIWRTLYIPSPDGGLIITWQDISKQYDPPLIGQLKQQATALAESNAILVNSNALLVNILSKCHDGVICFNGDAQLHHANQSFYDLWGVGPEKLSATDSAYDIASRMAGMLQDEPSARAHTDWLKTHLAEQRPGQFVISLDERRSIHARCDKLPGDHMVFRYWLVLIAAAEQHKQGTQTGMS